MGNTLRANVAEKLADIRLATHLRKKQEKEETREMRCDKMYAVNFTESLSRLESQ